MIKSDYMKEVTATKLARELGNILNEVEFRGQEYLVLRNKQKIARILPGPGHMTALEAMADIYQTIPADAAEGWIEESRLLGNLNQIKNSWDS